MLETINKSDAFYKDVYNRQIRTFTAQLLARDDPAKNVSRGHKLSTQTAAKDKIVDGFSNIRLYLLERTKMY